MPDFQVKISTPADLSGFVATEAEAAKVTQAVGGVTGAATGAATATGRFVDTAGRLREASGQFVATGKSAEQAGKSINEATGEAKGFLATIETGFGIGLGEGALHSLESIGEAFKGVVERGVEYNAEVQTLGIGLAATFRSVQPDKYLSFDQARQAGGAAIEELRAKANALGVDFRGLVESYSANFNALIEGGVTKPAQQIELVSTLTQAAASKGISGAQALRDSIDILNGRAGNINLAKELGITESALKSAAAAGDTYGYIMSKLGGYQEAAAAGADSYQGTLNRLHNQLDQLAGDVAKPAFDKLLTLLQGGSGGLANPQVSGAAKGVGNTLGGVLDDVGNAASGIKSAVGSTEAFLEAHPMTAKLLGLLTYGSPLKNDNTLANALASNVEASQADAEVDAQIKLVKGLQEKIAAAKDDKEIADARKEVEDAITAATQRTASALGVGKDQAKDFLVELQAVQRTFDQRAGSGLRGEADDFASRAAGEAKQDAAAFAKYQASPSDEATAAAEKHAKAVDKLAAALQKEDGFTAAAAKVLAEQNVTRAEATKQIEATNKALDSLLEKEGRAASSTDLLPKLRGVYDSVLDGIPAPSRAGLSDVPTDANLASLTKAVQSQPVAEGDEKAAKSKAELVKLLEQALALQKDYNAAVEREGSAAKEAEDNRKQHDATLAEQQENLTILQARAAGDDKTADALEKQKELRQAILALQEKGLTYTEAQRAATATQDAEQAVKDRQFADSHPATPTDSFARREGESGNDYFSRTGRIDGHASDSDPGGGLHTGGLQSGSLDTSSLLKPGDSVKVSNQPSVQKITGDVNVTNLPQPAAPGATGARDVSGGGLPLTDGSGRTFVDPGASLGDPKSAGFGDPSARLANPTASGFGDPTAAEDVPAGSRFGNLNNGAGGGAAYNPAPAPTDDGGTLASLFGNDLGGLFGGSPTAAANLGPTVAPASSGGASGGDTSAFSAALASVSSAASTLHEAFGTFAKNLPNAGKNTNGTGTGDDTPPTDDGNDTVSRLNDLESRLSELETDVNNINGNMHNSDAGN